MLLPHCVERRIYSHIYYTYYANPFSNNIEIEIAKPVYGARVSVESENTVRSALLAGEEQASLFLPLIGVKMSNMYRRLISLQVENLPFGQFKRFVVPVGSGLSLFLVLKRKNN